MNPSHLSNEVQSPAAAAMDAIYWTENAKAMRQVVTRMESLLKKLLREPMPPTPPAAWNHFMQLPEETQQDLIRGIGGQAEFIQGAIDQDIDGFNEQGMLKYAMGKLCLLGEHDSINDIAVGDVVEIFDAEHRQVYRSYSCFSLSNYSLLELATYPWFDLYERSNKVEGDVIRFSNSVLQGENTHVAMSDLIPEYSIRERRTKERAVFALQEKFLHRIKGALSKKNYCLSVKTVRELATNSQSQDIQYI